MNQKNSTTARKRGEVCDTQRRKSLTVRLTESEYTQIIEDARAEGRTASNYLHRRLFPNQKGTAGK